MRETIAEAQASATIEAARAAGIGYFDTLPWYGNGKSELRFGHVLRSKPRDSFVHSTKVAACTGDRASPTPISIPPRSAACLSSRASITAVTVCSELSLVRLGLNRVEAR